MKVLLDSCVYGKAREDLNAAGHDVIWTGDWAQDPGDSEILATAIAQQRVLITLDKDFGEIAVAQQVRHLGLVRLVDISARRHGAVSLHILEHYAADLAAGALITVEPGRVRVRPAEEPE